MRETEREEGMRERERKRQTDRQTERQKYLTFNPHPWTLTLTLTHQANLAKQEVRLKVATKELSEAQATLDEKQAELNIVQAKYDAAMGKKKVGPTRSSPTAA